ncbi:MAG: hypothetical protein ACYS18_08605 [Planctomycetota bacterium]|jgi:hypothetical protein
MNTKANLLVVALVLLAITTLVLSQGKVSAHINRVTGKVQVLDEADENVWVEFEVRKQESQPAEGLFRLWVDNNGKKTFVSLKYLRVDGEYAWFAGKCTRDSGGMEGRWLFLAVHDGGGIGRLLDHIWWEWLPATPDAENIAENKVESFEKPGSNRPIKSGDIVVIS